VICSGIEPSYRVTISIHFQLSLSELLLLLLTHKLAQVAEHYFTYSITWHW